MIFMRKKESDVIIVENPEEFWVSINTGRMKVNTGKGGLIMFLKELGNNSDLLKIEYNGIILNGEQKKELINSLSK